MLRKFKLKNNRINNNNNNNFLYFSFKCLVKDEIYVLWNS